MASPDDKDDGKAATAPKQAVIRRIQGTEESGQHRLLSKHIPAWVVSGAVHVMLIVTLITADYLMGSPKTVTQSDQELTVVPQVDEKPSDADLLNPEIGLDPQTPTAIEADKLADVNVQDAVQTPDNPGIAEATSDNKQDFMPAPGGIGSDQGVIGDAGNFLAGNGGGGFGNAVGNAFLGRGAATRSKMLASGGGNTISEAAVARGLVWLAKQQKAAGNWQYDGSSRTDTIAATGMSMLPFLAAGQTHKSVSKGNDYNYKANVEAGLKYLIANQLPNGHFKNSSGMYSHAIAAIALCELLGMTGDKNLVIPCQKAINYIVAAQGPNGSWGYMTGTNGDTSIVGWQVQALQSAKLCKELTVDKRSIEKSLKFLDTVANGSQKATYGYNSPGSNKVMTSVALLCRYYVGGWGPQNQGMAEGVKFLMKTQQPDKNNLDLYYYYYATQVLHFVEGEEWYKFWNPAMRDLLIDLQVPQGKNQAGSWDADTHLLGTSCGRLGATCMSLLTLEVYYRHLPLYKRDTAGLKELERAK